MIGTANFPSTEQGGWPQKLGSSDSGPRRLQLALKVSATCSEKTGGRAFPTGSPQFPLPVSCAGLSPWVLSDVQTLKVQLWRGLQPCWASRALISQRDVRPSAAARPVSWRRPKGRAQAAGLEDPRGPVEPGCTPVLPGVVARQAREGAQAGTGWGSRATIALAAPRLADKGAGGGRRRGWGPGGWGGGGRRGVTLPALQRPLTPAPPAPRPHPAAARTACQSALAPPPRPRVGVCAGPVGGEQGPTAEGRGQRQRRPIAAVLTGQCYIMLIASGPARGVGPSRIKGARGLGVPPRPECSALGGASQARASRASEDRHRGAASSGRHREQASRQSAARQPGSRRGTSAASCANADSAARGLTYARPPPLFPPSSFSSLSPASRPPQTRTRPTVANAPQSIGNGAPGRPPHLSHDRAHQRLPPASSGPWTARSWAVGYRCAWPS